MGLSEQQWLLEILEEKAKRRASQALLPFIQYMYPGIYQATWYHKYVCSVLDEFSKGNIPRLMIFIPPQHGKSTMMTEYLPALLLGQNPDERIILAAYNEELSAKFNRKIQRIIINKKYSEIFPNTKLNAKNIVTDAKGAYVRNSSEFEIVDKLGSLRSTGVGGGIAGMPAYTALLDDVIKNVAEANSPTYRERVYEWYTDELEARLHNHSKVAFTITRRHEDDLAGRLIARDGTVEEGGIWHVVKLPALKEDNSNPYDIRAIGEALWPERHSQERMEERRDKTPRTFASLYQQRPAPAEGNKVKRDWFNVCHEKEVPAGIVWDLWLDGAYTDKTANDPTGLMVAGYHAATKRLYIKHAHHAYMEMPQLINFVGSYCEAHDVTHRGRVMIEPKASGKSIRQILKSAAGFNVPSVEIKSSLVQEGKESRCQVAANNIQSGQVYLVQGNWNDKFVTQICSFPNATHDEYVDLIGYACDEYFKQTTKKGIQIYNGW